MENQDVYNNGAYERLNPTWHTEDSLLKARNVCDILTKNYITDLKTVCDVGCGTGQVLVHLRNMLGEHIDYTGYDISERAVDICNIHKHDGFARALRGKAKYKIFRIPLEVTAHTVLRRCVTGGAAPYHHIHYYCLESAFELLRRCGYEICAYDLLEWHKEQKMQRKLSLRERIKLMIMDAITMMSSPEMATRFFGGIFSDDYS